MFLQKEEGEDAADGHGNHTDNLGKERIINDVAHNNWKENVRGNREDEEVTY